MMQASPPPAQAKVCVVCGKDCSTIERVKDTQGRYTCKPCNDARLGIAPTAPSAASKPAPDIASLYERPASRPCPQCDKPVSHEAEICVACGYNLRSGKPVKTKLGKNDPNRAATLAAAATVQGKPKRWILAAVTGGFLGAVAWAGATYFMSDGAAWMGIVVGALAGVAVFLAARDFCCVKSMVYGVILAALFIGLGKGGSAALMTLTNGPKPPTEVTLNDEGAKAMYAREVGEDMVKNQGKQVYWPTGFSLENAKAQEHFPPEIWQETTVRWEKGGQGWQQQYRSAKKAELQDKAEEKFAEDRKQDLLERFDWMDAVYAGIGLMLAGLFAVGVPNMLQRN